jgi:hypothetical protein
MEWLLIIMAIRLTSNLRRETFATAGKERHETRQRFEGEPAPSTKATPLDTCETRKKAILLAVTRQVHVSQPVFASSLLLCRRDARRTFSKMQKFHFSDVYPLR